MQIWQPPLLDWVTATWQECPLHTVTTHELAKKLEDDAVAFVPIDSLES